MKVIDVTFNFKKGKNRRCKHLHLHRKIFLLYIGCTTNFFKKPLTKHRTNKHGEKFKKLIILCSALRDYFLLLSSSSSKSRKAFHCCVFFWLAQSEVGDFKIAAARK